MAPPSAEPRLNPGLRFEEYFSGFAGDSSWSELVMGQCREGYAYCWMGCLQLPPGCSEEEAECVDEDFPCCTETVTEDCLPMGNCVWQCKAVRDSTSDTETAQSVIVYYIFTYMYYKS